MLDIASGIHTLMKTAAWEESPDDLQRGVGREIDARVGDREEDSAEEHEEEPAQT